MFFYFKNILLILGFFLYIDSPLISMDWSEKSINQGISSAKEEIREKQKEISKINTLNIDPSEKNIQKEPIESAIKKLEDRIKWLEEKRSEIQHNSEGGLQVRESHHAIARHSTHPPMEAKEIIPVSIFHAFDMRYSDIISLLEKIKHHGYTHIQISPAQRSRTTIPHTKQINSNEMGPWWLRYQPVDFLEINNVYGDAEALSQLANIAHDKYGIELIGDLVFNDVAALDGLEKEEWQQSFVNSDKRQYRQNLKRLEIYNGFSMQKCMQKTGYAERFLNGDTGVYQECMADFEEWGQSDRYGHPRYRYNKPITNWLSGALPILKPTQNVFEIHQQHIQKLVNAGVRNFRFDAAKHMFRYDPSKGSKVDNLTKYIEYIKSLGPSFNYLEVVNDKDESKYKNIAPITDYTFFSITLIPVFRINGDLKALRHINPNTNNNVLFSETHDTASHRVEGNTGISEKIDDIRDMQLAITYILARNGGVPIILAKNAVAPGVPSGVNFRKIMHLNSLGKTHHEYIYDIHSAHDPININVMFMGREDNNGIYILNKSNTDQKISLTHDVPGFKSTQKYVEIKDEHGNISYTPLNGDIVIVPRRSAVYLVSPEALGEYHRHLQ